MAHESNAQNSGYNCPFGKVASDHGLVTFCQQKYNEQTSNYDIDTCPNGFFCFTPPEVQTSDKNVFGHCCPVPPSDAEVKPVCPVGDLHPTAKCADSHQIIDKPVGPDFLPYCPLDTHACFYNKITKQNSCCPLPCRRNITGFFSVDNICYNHVVLDESCSVDAQCMVNAECKILKDKSNLYPIDLIFH